MNKRNEFIWKTPAEGRYKNFVHAAPDNETVWLAGSLDAQLSVESDRGPALCVWPDEAFAARYLEEFTPDSQAEPFELELDAFMDQVESMPEGTVICVFPNGQDDACVDKETLLRDLEEELEMYE